MRGRFASGLLRQLGLHELIAGTPEHYVDIVIRCLADDRTLRSFQDRLSARRDTLFRDTKPIATLEKFIEDSVGQ
jgi:protein O-GlcNAc transferase